MKAFEPKYSGEQSKAFWKAIDKMKGPDRDEAYSLGIVLQNMELDVLRLIKLLK